jgi:hypothetical protein
MGRFTFVDEDGTVLFSHKDYPKDEGVSITTLAEDEQFDFLEEIAGWLASREQLCELYINKLEQQERAKSITIRKKILPKYFNDVLNGTKNFEIRKDEDGAEPGNGLYLEEYDGTAYTGRIILKRITYVLRNVPEYGLMEGYCIIGW